MGHASKKKRLTQVGLKGKYEHRNNRKKNKIAKKANEKTDSRPEQQTLKDKEKKKRDGIRMK